jgi:5'-3' exonuclease
MAHRVLLDVSSLMYRAHFAMGDTIKDPSGAQVGAIHGYLDMVTRLLVSRKPDEVVHVYDHEWRPTARTDIYPGYKSNRPPEPEGLGRQFELLREVLATTGMLQAQTVGWEAEDAIGAFVEDATDDDRVEIVSGDRDLLQLVRDPVVTLLFTVRGVS